MDFDGDGSVDALLDRRDGDVVGRVWLGDYPTWGVAAPDVEFTWSCASDLDRVEASPTRTDEMDGDGVDEIWLGGSSHSDDDCAGFGLPATVTGLVDVPTHPDLIPGVGGTPWGDLDGDGVFEWFFPGVGGEPHRYLSHPVSFADGDVQSASAVHPAAVFERVSPLGFDLDGDGHGDYTAGDMDELHCVTQWLLTGGPSGGVFSGAAAFTVHSDRAVTRGPYFVEDGAQVVMALEDQRNQPAGVRFALLPVP